MRSLIILKNKGKIDKTLSFSDICQQQFWSASSEWSNIVIRSTFMHSSAFQLIFASSRLLKADFLSPQLTLRNFDCEIVK